MLEKISVVLQDCLLSELYSSAICKKLAHIAYDESSRKLLLHYAEEENHYLESLRICLDKLSENCFFTTPLPDIIVTDYYKSLLEYITQKTADVHKYQTLCTKILASDPLYPLFSAIFHCKIRQLFGLLVLIAPEDISLKV